MLKAISSADLRAQIERVLNLREVIVGIRARSRDLDPEELDVLVEEARAEFCSWRSSQRYKSSRGRAPC